MDENRSSESNCEEDEAYAGDDDGLSRSPQVTSRPGSVSMSARRQQIREAIDDDEEHISQGTTRRLNNDDRFAAAKYIYNKEEQMNAPAEKPPYVTKVIAPDTDESVKTNVDLAPETSATRSSSEMVHDASMQRQRSVEQPRVELAPETSSEMSRNASTDRNRSETSAQKSGTAPRVEQLAPETSTTSSDMIHNESMQRYGIETSTQKRMSPYQRELTLDEPAGPVTNSSPGAFYVDGIGSSDGNRTALPSSSGGPTSVPINMPSSDDSRHLIPTAFLVPEEDEKEVVIAEKAPLCNANKKCVLLVAVAIIFVVTGLVLGIVLGIDTGPSEYTYSTLRQMIISASHDSVSIFNPASPQAAAFEWLWADPFLSHYSDARILERYALATLYFSTKGVEWRNNTSWLSYGISECEWAMVTCDDEGKIERILMGQPMLGNRLRGTIPKEIFHHLNDLFELDLSNNRGLKGTLPEDLGNSLGWLRMHDCALTGTLPKAAFSRLAHLRSIHFYRNFFEGTLPKDLFYLADLQALRLSDNRLSGTLSSSIGSLINLESLWLSRNRMTGSLPSELGQLIRLDELYCSYNKFNGTIPSELGKLIKMDEMSFKGNYFGGTMPDEVCGLLERNLLQLYADCREGGTSSGYVSCDCCTVCCRDRNEEECIPMYNTSKPSV